jgi:hypothetical protein
LKPGTGGHRKEALNDATGRDLLQFYYELQDAKSPLLKFMSRGRDKWLIIHEWLSDEQQT